MIAIIFEKILVMGSVLFGIIILLRSQEASLYASQGLLLWGRSVVPILLPYILLSGFWIRHDVIHSFIRLLNKCFPKHTFFCETFPLFMLGLFCGIPTGALFVNAFYENHHLSQKEAMQLLPLCSFVSPMFFLGYALPMISLSKRCSMLFVFSLYGSILLLYLFFLLRHRAQHATFHIPLQNTAKHSMQSALLDSSIHTTFTIGIYILLFSILCGLLKNLLPKTPPVLFFLSNLEITTGISDFCTGITSHSLHTVTEFFFLISLGGLCGIAQVYALSDSAIFSFATYFCNKIKQASIASILFACLYFLLCKQNILLF